MVRVFAHPVLHSCVVTKVIRDKVGTGENKITRNAACTERCDPVIDLLLLLIYCPLN